MLLHDKNYYNQKVTHLSYFRNAKHIFPYNVT